MKKKAAKIIAITLALSMMSSTVAFGEDYKTTIEEFDYGTYHVPAYDGDPSEEVNDNQPVFSNEEMAMEPQAHYGELDDMNRCTTAFAKLNKSMMPTWDRGEISAITPTGWVQEKYDVVSGGWLYNRCHLIGWQLTGTDIPKTETYAGEKEEKKAILRKNLITGTKYLNVGTGRTGMLEYENEVASYLKQKDDNAVSYRVTPVFFDDDLVAAGVLMEGQSVGSDEVKFCVFCYNVQPEIAIDYKTGKSRLASGMLENKSLSECTITTAGRVVYNGKKQQISIKIEDGSKILREGSDYETVYSSNILPGRATVQIVGLGEYKGNVRRTFIIVPSKATISRAQPSSKKIRICAKKQKGISGFQYSWRLKGKKWKSTYHKGNVRIIKKLKRKKTYQVRVRAYKIVDGNKWYGQWSKIKKVRVK